MQRMKAEYTDVRQHIIDQGKAIITRKGFAGVGLNEILSAADVPKGSFYHYFKSKELFGEAMLEDYVTGYLAGMEDVLGQQGRSAAQSLMAYWANWTSESLDGSGCDCRCLVVKLSSEVADMSEPMRVALLDGTHRIIARLALAIKPCRNLFAHGPARLYSISRRLGAHLLALCGHGGVNRGRPIQWQH